MGSAFVLELRRDLTTGARFVRAYFFESDLVGKCKDRERSGHTYSKRERREALVRRGTCEHFSLFIIIIIFFFFFRTGLYAARATCSVHRESTNHR